MCRQRQLSRSTCKAVSLSTTTSPLTDVTSSPITFCRRTRSPQTVQLRLPAWLQLRFRFSCTASLPPECRSPAQWDFDRTQPSFTSRCVSASPLVSLNHVRVSSNFLLLLTPSTIASYQWRRFLLEIGGARSCRAP